MNYRDRNINSSYTILEAMKHMDKIDKKLLLIIDNKNFKGLISIGDIQRAIIKNISLETNVSKILRKNIKVARPDDSLNYVKELMFEYRMELCPVVSNTNEIVEVLYWEDLFVESYNLREKSINAPVVIMAGGFGSRLKPLTNILPKPLIPIGEKTILETIMDKFLKISCNNFYLTVNYKADFIRYYLNQLKLSNHSIRYVQEDKPLGTAGSLSLLKDEIKETFFVSNCDILIEQNLSEIWDFHKENNNEITITAALKTYSIPYGTLETGDNGQLINLIEKPDLTFKINSGLYILEPHLLNEIPENTFYHITDLIQKIKNRNGKIGVFPVSEKAWVDIGEWNEYLKRIK